MRLVLASQSPRRRELLQHAGFSFTVRTAGVPEEHSPGESPTDYVRRLSLAKALAVPREPDECVLGADTVVVIDGQILEKPRDHADAARMLSLLSGRVHTVTTGIALVTASTIVQDHADTRVHFHPLSPEEIESYAASGEPMDKAGGYAIQDLASRWVQRIDGCYFNVVGLPVSLVYRKIRGLVS